MPKIIITSTPKGKNIFYSMFMNSNNYNKPEFIGVDWCAGNGVIRGEIIKRSSNIIYVRFKTVRY